MSKNKTVHYEYEHIDANSKVKISNYHPLSKRDIRNLLRQAKQTGSRIVRNSIQMRLCQGIKGCVYPARMTGEVAKKEAQISELYLKNKYNSPTNTLVNMLYKIMSTGEIKAETNSPIAVSVEELQQFGCPYCGYRSGHSSISGRGGVVWYCGDGECGRSCVGLSKGLSESPFGIGSGEETVYPKLQDHPRRGILAHGKLDKKPENGGEFFQPRGIGLDQTPGCFVCGGDPGLYRNISAFVQCKDAGERVVAMFNQRGAGLDYREHEPDRVQVKIGACKKHAQNLDQLDKLTSQGDNSGIITEEIIKIAISM